MAIQRAALSPGGFSGAPGAPAGPVFQSGPSDVGGILADFRNQYATAIASNKARYEATLKGFQDRESKVQEGLASYGQNELEDATRRGITYQSDALQSAYSHGLQNTSRLQSLRRNAQNQIERERRYIGNDIANARANAYARTSGDTLGFQGSYKDPMPSFEVMAGLANSAGSLAEREREFNASLAEQQAARAQAKDLATRSHGGGGGGGGGQPFHDVGSWLNQQLQSPSGRFLPNNSYGYNAPASTYHGDAGLGPQQLSLGPAPVAGLGGGGTYPEPDWGDIGWETGEPPLADYSDPGAEGYGEF